MALPQQLLRLLSYPLRRQVPSHYQCRIDQVWFISRPSSPPESFPLANRHRPRMASDTSLGSPVSSWVELPNSLLEHIRTRPASVSRQIEGGKEAIVNGNGEHTSSSRPGILRSHDHSSSNHPRGIYPRPPHRDLLSTLYFYYVFHHPEGITL